MSECPADIFFFITTIWVIILSAILAVILGYIAIILNDVRHISRKIREGSEALSEDLQQWRETVKTEGVNVLNVVKYFKHLFTKRQSRKK